MDYELVITERAAELLDNLLNYLVFRLKNEQAALHLLNGVDKIYSRMDNNPFQFPPCKDSFLNVKGYREAVIQDMDYLLVFKVDENVKTVHILGIFHSLENYEKKL